MSQDKRYFHEKQLMNMLIGAHDEYCVWSRGSGKSEGVDAPRLLRNVQAMPRSAGAIVSPTYTKLLQNTLPAVANSLARMGYYRDRHYIIGRKPDPKLQFGRPIIEPFEYDHVMTWYNGTIVHLISFDRPMSANSLSIDWMMGFEAKFLRYDKLVNEAFPAMRGNNQYFGDCPWHGGKVFTTDMPTQSSGMWILEKEKEMDIDLIDMIKDLILERKKLKAILSTGDASRRIVKELKLVEKDLNLFRSNAVLYSEADIFDNLELIGEKRIKEFSREMPPLVFATSILNKKPKKIANGFYSALNSLKHGYDPPYATHMESYEYDLERSKVADCRGDADIDPNLPICLTNDCNSSINNLITGQLVGNVLRTLRNSWVKTPKKLVEVCEEWCDYYQYLPNKEVFYFFDSTMIHTDPRSDESFADIIVKVLTERGFTVTRVYIGQPPKHDMKHGWIDQALKGNPEFIYPTFNNLNCEYLMLAMSMTGIRYGKNGFEKDKRIEASEDTPDNPDELKTHATDAWDTLFVGCQYFYPGATRVIPTAQQW